MPTAAEEDPHIVVFDPTRPSVARMYDFYLGGEDHFPIDRELAERVVANSPTVVPALQANRACLGRIVRHLSEQGINQFIDLGSGLPSQGNVHEVAQQINPDARIAYVDNDLTVLGHARAILARTHAQNVIVIKGDIRAPRQILTDPDVHKLINFDEPVAVLMVAVLHFITEDEDPYRIVRAFRESTPTGSYLAVTIATTDGTSHEERAAIEGVYKQATAPAVFRTRKQIERLFDGYQLQDPGLVRIPDWRPVDKETDAQQNIGAHWFYCGLGYKD
jgi:hypothetical protein